MVLGGNYINGIKKIGSMTFGVGKTKRHVDVVLKGQFNSAQWQRLGNLIKTVVSSP